MTRKQTVSYAPGKGLDNPMIKIANHFLQQYGFAVGTEIEVTYADGIITIHVKRLKV